jgi:hypothetical protein
MGTREESVKADNYLAVVVSPSVRQAHGEKADYYFPFANHDTKSITRAQLAAEAKRRELEMLDIEVALACWRYCDMLDLPVICHGWISQSHPGPRNQPKRVPWWQKHDDIAQKGAA